jgi:hypothetical protein
MQFPGVETWIASTQHIETPVIFVMPILAMTIDRPFADGVAHFISPKESGRCKAHRPDQSSRQRRKLEPGLI